MKRKGISLIVLVITIVVIIILAAAVILSLGNNNPISNAKKAKVEQTMDTFKSDLSIQVSNKLLDNTSITVSDINSKDEDGWRITDLVPSIKGTEYESQLIVVNGKLKLKDGSTLPDTIQDIIKESLGEAVAGSGGNEGPTPPQVNGTIITKAMIEANPSAYIGKSVTYTGYSENTNTIDWRLFGIDKDGNIMLKANDYIDLTYKKSSYPSGIAPDMNKYNIGFTTDRTTLINYIGTSSNWSEFAVSGKTIARGAMTLPEFVNGYNLVNSTKLDATYLTAGQTYPDNSSKTARVDGYVIKKGTGSYSPSVNDITQTYNGMKFSDISLNKASAMWLASEHTEYSLPFCVTLGGYVGHDFYVRSPYALCPAVSLTGGILVEKADGTLVVE